MLFICFNLLRSKPLNHNLPATPSTVSHFFTLNWPAIVKITWTSEIGSILSMHLTPRYAATATTPGLVTQSSTPKKTPCKENNFHTHPLAYRNRVPLQNILSSPTQQDNDFLDSTMEAETPTNDHQASTKKKIFSSESTPVAPKKSSLAPPKPDHRTLRISTICDCQKIYI